MRWRHHFYRFTAAYFVISAVTGLLLYFRPLKGERAGLYSESVKEWLVMIHNGEVFSWLAFHNRYVTGVLIGSALAFVLLRFSIRSLGSPRGVVTPLTVRSPLLRPVPGRASNTLKRPRRAVRES